jgi:pimeloyl-ACP methyl ester carboxylesterase
MTGVSQTSPPRCCGPACSPITACGVIRLPPCAKQAGGRSRSTRPATNGAPVLGVASPWTSAHRLLLRSWTQPAFARRPSSAAPPGAGSWRPGSRCSRPSTWDRRRFITTVRSVLIDRDPVLDALPELKVPALIVSGQEDRTLPSFHSQRMAQKLPNARHVEVCGAAHLVPLEAPHEANPLILDFLRDLTPRPTGEQR